HVLSAVGAGCGPRPPGRAGSVEDGRERRGATRPLELDVGSQLAVPGERVLEAIVAPEELAAADEHGRAEDPERHGLLGLAAQAGPFLGGWGPRREVPRPPP